MEGLLSTPMLLILSWLFPTPVASERSSPTGLRKKEAAPSRTHTPICSPQTWTGPTQKWSQHPARERSNQLLETETAFLSPHMRDTGSWSLQSRKESRIHL
jgi:hypothetical protein